ncbi:MAG: DUF4126 family protein [Chloroflexota bacterium]
MSRKKERARDMDGDESAVPEVPTAGSWIGALGRALGLGVVTGFRSTFALALLSRVGSRHGLQSERLPSWLFQKRAVRGLSAAMAGEFLADKMPFTPSRLNGGSLAGRAVSGGLAGIASFRLAEKPALAGLGPGVAGALAGSFAGGRGRAWLVKRTGLPDPVVAVGEDLLAAAAGRAIIRRPWLGLVLFSLAVAVTLRTRVIPESGDDA